MRSMISVNKAGGVGKTMLCELLCKYVDRIDAQYKTYCIDGEGLRENYQSPLRRAIPHTKDVFFQTPFDKPVHDLSEQLRMWCSVIDPVLAGNHIVDFGANALASYQYITQMMGFNDHFWDGVADTQKRMRPILFIPVTAGHVSQLDAIDILKWLFRDGAINAYHHVVVVQNEVQGQIFLHPGLERVIRKAGEKVSLISIEYNSFARAIADYSINARELDEFQHAPEREVKAMLDDGDTMLKLATATAVERWSRKIFDQFDRIGLLKMLKVEANSPVSVPSGSLASVPMKLASNEQHSVAK